MGIVSWSFSRLRTGISRRISSARRCAPTRPRGFRADVDHVRALFFEFDRPGEGAIRIGVLATIGKRIRRDVEHGHQQRAVSELNFRRLSFQK